MLPILKLLTPKVIKAIMEYVFEDNQLDMQMGAVQKRLSKLEKLAHPAREFVVCSDCQTKIMEKAKDNAGIAH